MVIKKIVFCIVIIASPVLWGSSPSGSPINTKIATSKKLNVYLELSSSAQFQAQQKAKLSRTLIGFTVKGTPHCIFEDCIIHDNDGSLIILADGRPISSHLWKILCDK